MDKDVILNRFGYSLNSIRISKQMSIKQLSNRSGLSESKIFNLERNEYDLNELYLDELVNLCIALDVSLSELVGL